MGSQRANMPKRQREDDFVELLLSTLLADEKRPHDQLTKPQLQTIFRDAVSQLPESQLRRGLEKRVAAHSQTVFDNLKKTSQAAAVTEAPSAKRRSRKGAASQINLLQA